METVYRLYQHDKRSEYARAVETTATYLKKESGHMYGILHKADEVQSPSISNTTAAVSVRAAEHMAPSVPLGTAQPP